jgi:ADP-ribose pyrophosphatase YjhB (NUDIX family)
MIEQITELQSIAQSGLAYCKDKFDIERYKRILEITATLFSMKSDQKYEHVLELFKKGTGYVTPKIDVRAAVFKEDKILLVQQKSDHLWALPGGWADVNLSPSENILKEIKEETGFNCKVIKIIGIFDKRKNNGESKRWPHVYKLFFLCQIFLSDQSDFDKNEILDIKFYDPNEIPSLSTERTNKQQIELCFKHFYDPYLQATFD